MATATLLMACSPESTGASLDLEIELTDQVAPLGRLTIDVGGVLRWAGGELVAALGVDALLHVGALDQLLQLRIEPVDDRLRRAGRRQHAVMQHGFEAGHPGLL